MILKKKFAEKLKKIIEEKKLTQKDIEIIEKKNYIPILEDIIEDGLIFEENEIKIYKKDKLIGTKIGKLMIKIVYDLTFDEKTNSIVIPLSIDEGDQFLLKLINDSTEFIDIISFIVEYLGEKEKGVILENIRNVNDDYYYKLVKNFPPKAKISGILDDIIAKVCEKMTNLELVAFLSNLEGKEKRKILRNVSENRSIILQEELDYITYFTKKEIRESINKFYRLLKIYMEEF